MNSKFVQIKAAVTKNKRKIIPIAMIVIGIILVIVSSRTPESNAGKSYTLSEYKSSLESELSELCSKIEGVGKCYVSVSFARGEQNSYKGSSLIETKPPEVLGVTVICKGADSDYVRGRIIDMVSALFNIGSNRIAVLKLK